MLAQDVPVWQKWLSKHSEDIKNVYYNVALTLNPAPEVPNPNMVNNWMYSVSKRIDALVIWDNESMTIVEVTRKGGLRAIGQAITYQYLWRQIKPLPGKCTALIVCVYADKDVRATAEEHGVEIETIEP